MEDHGRGAILSQLTLNMCGICRSSCHACGPMGLTPECQQSWTRLWRDRSVISWGSWDSGEVPVSWALVSIAQVSRKDENDAGNYRPGGLALVAGGMMEKVIPRVTKTT